MEAGWDFLPETAYYYPEPFWFGDEGGWLKTLLLFFDKVTILLPEDTYGRHSAADPILAGPLEDMGLLVVLKSEHFVDAKVTDALAKAIGRLLEVCAFDDLPPASHFAELSCSRMAGMLTSSSQRASSTNCSRRGLARDSEDGMSVPLHPTLRTAILVLLSQFARAAGQRQGLDLHPITSSRERVLDLIAR